MEMSILQQDYQKIAESNLPFDKYRGCTFLVTGGTGLIGTLLINSLLYCNQVHILNIKIIVCVRDYEKAKRIYGELMLNTNLFFVQQDLMLPLKEITIDVIDYIIHTAAITASKNMIEFPVENIKTAVNGTMSMLDLAKRYQVRGMVFVSSMEAYGYLSVTNHMIKEDELGYIDLSSVRSSYPEGKRICECMCNAYANEYNINVKIARLAQTFGAGILEGENRIFAQFAKSVIKGEDIILHTQGLSEGNYVYTSDAIEAIMLLLTEGTTGNTYNVSNERSHSAIRDMASMVAEKIAGGTIKVKYDIPENVLSLGYARDVKMHLSSEKLRKLGWNPKVGLMEAYQRMICYMKSTWKNDD